MLILNCLDYVTTIEDLRTKYKYYQVLVSPSIKQWLGVIETSIKTMWEGLIKTTIQFAVEGVAALGYTQHISPESKLMLTIEIDWIV